MMNEDAEDSRRRSTFHLDEFKFIKTKLIEDTKAAAFNFRFTLIPSGAVAAWLVEHQPINRWPGFGYEINGKPRKPKSSIELIHSYWAKFLFVAR